MTADDPSFQEPEPASRYQLSPEKISRKLAFWQKNGRRCDGANRTCVHNAATAVLVVVELNSDGTDKTEPYSVKTCSRHRQQWTRKRLMYRVISDTPIPPMPEKEREPRSS